MKNNTINMVTEVKENGKYKVSYTYDDALYIYDRLAHDMIAKKINRCTWITSIKRTPLYNGFDRITVTYNNKVRNIYTIESR